MIRRVLAQIEATPTYPTGNSENKSRYFLQNRALMTNYKWYWSLQTISWQKLATAHVPQQHNFEPLSLSKKKKKNGRTNICPLGHCPQNNHLTSLFTDPCPYVPDDTFYLQSFVWLWPPLTRWRASDPYAHKSFFWQHQQGSLYSLFWRASCSSSLRKIKLAQFSPRRLCILLSFHQQQLKKNHVPDVQQVAADLIDSKNKKKPKLN